MTVDRRDLWLALAAEWLGSPRTEFPLQQAIAALSQSFPDANVYWNIVWNQSAVHAPAEPTVPPPQVVLDWASQGGMARHPLLRWFATGSSSPQTLMRVPEQIAPMRFKQEWTSVARPWGLEQQLSIPVAVDGRSYETFVIYRDAKDFTADDVEFAAVIQPMLEALRRQADALDRWRKTAWVGHGDGPRHGLTTRESAVLSLVSDGHTAKAIGHRLSISERTVHKHMEHINGKLGVRDRVSAVVRAQQLGLLPHPGPAAAVHVDVDVDVGASGT